MNDTVTEPEPRAPLDRSAWHWIRWVLLAAVVGVVVLFGAIFIYANFINDPEDALTTEDLAAALTTTTAAPAPATTEGPATEDLAAALTTTTAAPPTTTPAVVDGVDGTWVVTEDSELGYRVVEVLFGVNTEGVGRTNQVTGSITIDGTQVSEGGFVVDVASITSDDSRRDGQFRGRIMTVSEFPTAEFVLTEPIELGSIPDDGEPITTTATGELTLRGVTNPVTFDVTAQRQGERIGVLGNIEVVFADYRIANPSISGITTEDRGLLEFVLVFER